MSKIVDLRLIRTQKSDPVILVDARTARDSGGGTLLWEGGTYHISTENNADPNRFDGAIIREHISSAAGWCENMPGGKAKKLTRKLRKLLKQAGKL